MKMPATTTIMKVEAKPSTDLCDAAKQCLNCIEKKVRNLEKRKGKIEMNREKADKGTKLEKEAEKSLQQYEQVTHDLEFARELHKQFLSINSENEKLVKKQTKREKAERQAVEIKRVGEILRLQTTLDLLGGSEVREDFKTGKHGAVVLTEDNLDQLDKVYQAISPSRDDCGDEYPQRLFTAAEHMVNILDGKDRQVLGTTYKELRELLTLINECGYFEKANAKPEEVAVDVAEAVEEDVEDNEDNTDEVVLVTSESVESTPEPEQQPIDLTVTSTETTLELQQQPLNTMEQDALFTPSSTAFQENSGARYSPVYQQAPNYESFTNNRPFQFIQTSYVMSESQATTPSLEDPAVIHAQPAANSTAYMSQGGYDPAAQLQTVSHQPQSLPQQLPISAQQTPPVNIAETHPQQPSSQPPQPQSQQQAQTDYSQNYSQSNLQQSMQQEGLYNASTVVVDDVPSSMTSHSNMMGQIRDENSPSSFEIPPSIPMPPSQQSQSQIEQQLQQQQEDEKKFQMNVSAPVFNPSMYAQVTGQPSQTVPSGTTDNSTGPATGDYNNGAVDYQQGYQNNGYNGYSRGRGGGGNFRGSRGAGAPNNNNRNGSSGQIQNGYGNRGNSNQNSRGGRGGTYQGQGYQQNANANYSRPESYQGQSNQGQSNQGQSNYSTGGINKYQNRGGMNNTGAPGNSTYARGGPGGNGGPRGNGGRGGGMRGGGMSRGGSGDPRGGSGDPRGGSAPRGGYNRPPPQ